MLTTTIFIAFELSEVRGLDYTFTGCDETLRCLPSSLYTFSGSKTGYGSGLPSYCMGFPEFGR